MTKSWKGRYTLVSLWYVVWVLLVVKPGRLTPLWFDEGWVISLARNWVELGHYGHLKMGQPVSTSVLAAGLPVVAPIAASFRLFGIGAWQARLPGVFFTVGALACLVYRRFAGAGSASEAATLGEVAIER